MPLFHASSSGYDAAGNMTTLRTGMTAVYDAWNRMTKVTTGSGESLTVVQQNEYDGANRRIRIFSDFNGSTPGMVQDDYNNGQQVIESRCGEDGQPTGGHQYLWSPRYIDSPILRDTLDSGGEIVAAERILYLSDANYNVTGLVKYNSGESAWQVVERYSYTPYGVATFRDAAWSTAGSSANNNTTLYTGRVWDALISLYFYRTRFHDAVLERFISRDPIGYKGGINLYRYVGNNPLIHTDPTGKRFERELEYAWAKCRMVCGADNPIKGALHCVEWFYGGSFTKNYMVSKAESIANDAMNEAANILRRLGKPISTQNLSSLQHCIASAKYAKWLGCTCSGCLGRYREEAQYVHGDQDFQETVHTNHYNEVGRQCAGCVTNSGEESSSGLTNYNQYGEYLNDPYVGFKSDADILICCENAFTSGKLLSHSGILKPSPSGDYFSKMGGWNITDARRIRDLTSSCILYG